MGWSGPGRKRHRAVRMRVGHACGAGHRCRGGLKAHAPSVGRPGFASGPSGSSDAAGRRPGRSARDHAARRGQRHGSTPYASIADDSEVDLDRPIKCCDDIHSISHYPPPPATRGREALRGMPTIREILTVARCARCVRTRQYGVPMRNSTRPVTRIEGGRQARDSGSLQQGRGIRSRQAGTSRRGERKAEDIRPIPSGHIHARDAMSSTSEMGETAGGGWPARRSGPWQWLIEAGGALPVWPAKRPGRLPG